MGQRGFRRLAEGAPVSDAATPAGPDPTERLSLTAPSAAVVGAGIAGVHVAYELAKLGFQVTVFERRNDVAGGETSFSLPFVGVGLLEPSLARSSFSAEVLRGMLFPSVCPELIARENLFNTVLNPVVYRWMLGRIRSSFTAREVMDYTNNLSCLSHTVVRDLVNKHPQLQQHVFSGPVTVLGENKEPVVTAHPEPLMVDPVGWMRTLADVCARQHGVQFALCERLEDTVTYLKYDVESTKSIRVSKQDPTDPSKRVFASERYDVVVLAAGASTGTLTLPNSRLPVLGLSGISALVQQPSGAVKDTVWSLFQRQPHHTADEAVSQPPAAGATSLARPAPATLAVLSSRCSLYGYTWPATLSRNSSNSSAAETGDAASSSALTSMLQSKVMPTTQDVVLQGLLSLDTTVKTQTHALVRQQLERLESYLRVKCSRFIPLHDASSNSTAAQQDGEQRSSGTVTVREYVRGFTPDGVPIVDHNGGAFNCFVCCGFGDHAMDFAPGAAKVLGRLVEHEAQRLREADVEQVKTWGLLTTKLTPSRRAEVEDELQLLFNGIDPEVTRGTTAAAAAQVPLKFQGNPFSTDRLTGMVQKEVKVVTGPALLDQLNGLEEGTLTRFEPYRRRFHAIVADWATRRHTPDWVRTIVFYYMFEEDDSPAAVAQREKHAQQVRALAEEYEAPASGAALGEATPTPAERSNRKQAELERRARELFAKPN